MRLTCCILLFSLSVDYLAYYYYVYTQTCTPKDIMTFVVKFKLLLHARAITLNLELH